MRATGLSMVVWIEGCLQKAPQKCHNIGMTRPPARDMELPDYLEIGHAEVYEDPGSTLPENCTPLGRTRAPSPNSAPNAGPTNREAAETLPADLTEAPAADSVRVINGQDAPLAASSPILASHGRSGRLPQDGPIPKRVLVVDDDLTARLYLRARLMLRGNVSIFEASNAAQGLALLKAQPTIDAALLDVDLGEQNGFELCKAIRAWARRQGGRQPTIYMITSRTSVLDKMRAKMAGADAFLSKPPSPKELASFLAHL
jgi:CheY-like chemotaxis protein